jgi:hypothetical protein
MSTPFVAWTKMLPVRARRKPERVRSGSRLAAPLDERAATEGAELALGAPGAVQRDLRLFVAVRNVDSAGAPAHPIRTTDAPAFDAVRERVRWLTAREDHVRIEIEPLTVVHGRGCRSPSPFGGVAVLRIAYTARADPADTGDMNVVALAPVARDVKSFRLAKPLAADFALCTLLSLTASGLWLFVLPLELLRIASA